MSQSLYTFPTETTQKLRKFRLSSARAKEMEAQIYSIDPKTYEIKYQEPENEPVLNSIESLVEELPENTPRFIVLSYPYTSSDGRLMNPLVFVYYRPSTSKQESKMLYAGCLEQFKDKISANKFIEIDDEEDFEELADHIKK
ncbi:unnamed protein product [Ambrosiozyma monospora]|uniref:Unnamed protein product n=1 Tax=Ambrosiozyma monospora TaxID=43982 RepID=A0ACB5SZP3_AMBMO|nr:unnamed protein product [Ambrosiozyma monospora]